MATPAPSNNVILFVVQPTKRQHLGSYLGAVKNWVSLQKDFERTRHHRIYPRHVGSTLLSFVVLMFLVPPPLAAKDDGVCYEWSEGDARHLMGCTPSTLSLCSKGREPISNKMTAFQGYTGKLFRSTEDTIYEFVKKAPEDCDKELVANARSVEASMSVEWGTAVYSNALKVGDKAYIFGNSVLIQDRPSKKASKVASPADLTPVKVVERSAKTSTFGKPNERYPMQAYWFKVSVGNKLGWVFGEFLHPDPKSKKKYISSPNE